MSEELAGTPGVPGPEGEREAVFRSELNPVDFLHRAAYVYPDKVAVVGQQAALHHGELAERVLAARQRAQVGGPGKGDRVAALLFNSSTVSRRISACCGRRGPRCDQ